MVAVADDADGAVASFVEAANLTGAHFDESPATIAVGKDCALSGGACDFAATTWKEFDVMNFRSERHFGKWHGVADFWCGGVTGDDTCSVSKTGWRENVGFRAVLVLNQGDAASAVGIILDTNYGGFHVALVALKIDKTIVTLMTTADVTCGDTACIVPST